MHKKGILKLTFLNKIMNLQVINRIGFYFDAALSRVCQQSYPQFLSIYQISIIAMELSARLWHA